MFASFFPRPQRFFWSAALWIVLAVALWYAGARSLGRFIGLPQEPAGAPAHIGIDVFWSTPQLWFDVYFWFFAAAFAAFWRIVAPHPWWRWSILGSALILFASYLQVEVTVTINNWRQPFFDVVQAALGHTRHVAPGEYYGLAGVFAIIAGAAITISVLTAFLVSHYIFRWRTAMNDFYADRWVRLRHIEGASQRVQEDTMRFAQTMEDLAVSFINSIMTLLAFLPVLVQLSAHVTVLPFIGHVSNALVLSALLWSAFGTAFLALLGVRLPGLYFRNQRVEAAYRKELVYGEDDEGRAQPATLRQLFANVRHNYFRLYFNYVYFNVGRYLYLQTDSIFPYIILGPTVLAGAITLGLMQEILGAFGEVRNAFQYLVNSWSTIVELQSVFKRLRSFEATLGDEALPAIEYTPH